MEQQCLILVNYVNGTQNASISVKVCMLKLFLAVQDSSIGDLVTESVTHLLISATLESTAELS